jgi:nicotinamidase-related amidase
VSTALVVIDVQNDYFPGGRMEVPGSTAAARHVAELLGAARAARWPVLHVQHLSSRPDATFLVPGTPGVEIHPLAFPAAGEPVVQKHFPNGFRGTTLLEEIRKAGADRLLICGMMTQMCVDATTRAAFDLGLRCELAADACAARPMTFGGRAVTADDVHAAFVAALGSVYARAATTAELLPGITRTGG